MTDEKSFDQQHVTHDMCLERRKFCSDCSTAIMAIKIAIFSIIGALAGSALGWAYNNSIDLATTKTVVQANTKEVERLRFALDALPEVVRAAVREGMRENKKIGGI